MNAVPRERLAAAGAELAPAAEFFHALSNPHRLRIVLFLHDNGPTRVGELTTSLDLTVSHTSQQLRRLVKVGLVVKVAPATYGVAGHPLWKLVRGWVVATVGSNP